nr:MAG TPA: hypothetical protein [Caudoviricetes sp.]
MINVLLTTLFDCYLVVVLIIYPPSFHIYLS